MPVISWKGHEEQVRMYLFYGLKNVTYEKDIKAKKERFYL